MKHFSDQDWLDFVRGMMPVTRLADLQEHLGECPDCRRLRRFWETVREVVGREAANQVPQHVVSAGQMVFADWQRKFVLPSKILRARPIFDSLLTPLAMGVRAIAPPPRRTLHRCGKWMVDLRIELEPAGRISVVGQVLKPGLQPEEAAKTNVLLRNQQTVVAETFANRFGEFQFALNDAPDLEIVIRSPGRRTILVALPDSTRPLELKKTPGVKKDENSLR